jgi:hypothetical protein
MKFKEKTIKKLTILDEIKKKPVYCYKLDLKMNPLVGGMFKDFLI